MSDIEQQFARDQQLAMQLAGVAQPNQVCEDEPADYSCLTPAEYARLPASERRTLMRVHYRNLAQKLGIDAATIDALDSLADVRAFVDEKVAATHKLA